MTLTEQAAAIAHAARERADDRAGSMSTGYPEDVEIRDPQLDGIADLADLMLAMVRLLETPA